METVCQHFGVCGGCTLQHLSPEAYRARKRQDVVDALGRVGLGDIAVEELVSVPLRARRRAVFKLSRSGDLIALGFHAARSHTIVDMRECLVLTPALLALAQRLRATLGPLLQNGESCEIHATDSDTGFDLALRWARKLNPALAAEMGVAVASLPVARMALNGEILLENAAPRIAFDGVAVALPPASFLQASKEGERELQTRVKALAKGAKMILDLFAGLGTFSLPLARGARVHAVEQDAGALAALAAAARGASGLKPITVEKRDLFKNPLAGLELGRFDLAMLDPPRAGASAQIRALAASSLPRIIYVSCDAASFARDAKILVDAGFASGAVQPIDQFLFSGHIELIAGFSRGQRPARLGAA